MKKFAAFDIDGTLIRWQLFHAMTDHLAKEGIVDKKLYQQSKNARMAWKKREHNHSFSDYEKTHIKAHDAVLTKLTSSKMEQIAHSVFEEYKDQAYRFTSSLIVELKNKGYFLMAISGSQSEIVKKIADYYGFDDSVGTTYEQIKGHFSGKKKLGSLDKATTLRTLIEKHRLTTAGSVAVGDSSSDISMLEIVETPIAINPEKSLFEHAKKAGWKIVIERKNVIYELEQINGKYQLAETST